MNRRLYIEKAGAACMLVLLLWVSLAKAFHVHPENTSAVTSVMSHESEAAEEPGCDLCHFQVGKDALVLHPPLLELPVFTISQTLSIIGNTPATADRVLCSLRGPPANNC